LLIIIKVNKLIKNKVLPLWLLFLIKVLNSLCKILIRIIQIILKREGISQYIGGITKKISKDLNQFIDIKEKVVGSKEENKLVIIFKLLWGFYKAVCIF